MYNVGGHNERTNLEIVQTVLREMGKPDSLISHIQDRPGHDRRYAIDNTKITTELGWRPVCSFEEGIRKTIRWYIENTDWLEGLRERGSL